MKEHYVTYKQAQQLHAFGFDGCAKYYVTENFCIGDNPYFFNTFAVGDLVDEHIVYFVNDNNEEECRGIPAPRLDQACDWLRKTKGIIISIGPCFYMGRKPLMGYEYHLYDKNDGMSSHIVAPTVYDTYEQAISASIDKALELLNNKS